jgi:glycosyltransferase involved in cell wall biosynthesis
MPRLLQITDKPTGGGGIRRVLDRDRRLLEERGWTVETIRLVPQTFAQEGRERVVTLPLTPRLSPDASPLDALRRAAASAGAVHLHLGFSALPPEAVVALAENAPLIVGLHDISPFDGIGVKSPGSGARPRSWNPKARLASWRFGGRRRATWRALCEHARLMLAPSRFLADLAVAAGLPSDRSRVLFPALDTDSALAPRPPSACPPVICYAGLLSSDKGAPLLLEAFARLRCPEARLQMLGDGPSLRDLHRRAGELGLSNRVTLEGRVSPARVAETFAAARVVDPSLVPEGFGLVGIEAFQQGRPVAGFGLGGTREWLVPEVTGILAQPPDPATMAAALSRLLGDGELADRLGAAGQTLACHRHAPEEVGRALDATLREAAGLAEQELAP